MGLQHEAHISALGQVAETDACAGQLLVLQGRAQQVVCAGSHLVACQFPSRKRAQAASQAICPLQATDFELTGLSLRFTPS